MSATYERRANWATISLKYRDRNKNFSFGWNCNCESFEFNIQIGTYKTQFSVPQGRTKKIDFISCEVFSWNSTWVFFFSIYLKVKYKGLSGRAIKKRTFIFFAASLTFPACRRVPRRAPFQRTWECWGGGWTPQPGGCTPAFWRSPS